MNSDDHRDQLLDMLLREVVGGENPTDVRDSVLRAVRTPSSTPQLRTPPQHGLRARPSLQRKSKSPVFAIAAILMLTAACVSLIHFQKIAASRTPSLVTVSGTVSHAPGALFSGNTIRTAGNSTALLRYPDGTEVEISPGSAVSIPELSLMDRSKRLQIILGGISADVSPQGHEHPMTLISEHARAVVVGTTLTFHSTPERTRLEVTEGEVRLEPNNSLPHLQVTAGNFAEADHSAQSRSGPIEPVPEKFIAGFTLMNAVTNQPIDGALLIDGQSIALSSLPTKEINLRAELNGERPFNVNFTVTRKDGGNTRIPPQFPQHVPPYFVAGDHSGAKRPSDCRSWTPPPGAYHIKATPTLSQGEAADEESSYSIDLIFTR